MTKYDHKFPVIKFIYLNCGYITHCVFLCLAGSENVLFRLTSSVSTGFQHLWLVAIFIYDHNFTIYYDEVTTKLWRLYDRKFVI